MSFVPSESFFERPKKETLPPKRVPRRHAPTNTLTFNEEKGPEKLTDAPSSTSYFTSCLLKSSNESYSPKKPLKKLWEDDIPIQENELQEEVLNKAFTQKFIEVKEQKPKQPRKTKPKQTENFVKLNLNKAKSAKKLGKTRYCRKKQFPYKNSVHQIKEELHVAFSEGYTSKVRSEHTNLDSILTEEFKFTSFREGQKESIAAVLENQNVLTILPTGAGKSLIYQMCARVLEGITVVITPLKSLISDQIMRLPNCLSGACLHSDLPVQLQIQVRKSIQENKLDILFITPEKFIVENTHLLPKVSLTCIDECHCLSMLSNSYRYSYLLIPDLLKTKVLALSATVHSDTQAQICKVLNIQTTIKKGKALRSNLRITVSKDEDLLTGVSRLLRTKDFKKGSVIVYSPFQGLANNIAQWVKSKGESCASFHGGLPEDRKSYIQEQFANGSIRVLVATVSFGMGIDKSNVEGVIHLYPPKSLEHLVQETGRAGRNGSTARCHIFLSPDNMFKIRTLNYSNHISKKQVLQILKKFGNTDLKRKELGESKEGQQVVLKLNETCEDLGLEKDILVCLLLSLKNQGVVKMQPLTPITAQIKFHKSQPSELAQKFAILSHVLNNCRNFAGVRRVHLPDIASSMDLEVNEVIYALRRIAASGEISCQLLDESLILEAENVPQDLEMLRVAESLEKEFFDVEEVWSNKLETCYSLLFEFAEHSYVDSVSCTERLSDCIESYLEGNLIKNIPKLELPSNLEMDFFSILSSWEGVPEAKDLACVLQGINTRRTPASRWSSHHMWSSYVKFSFSEIYQEARAFLIGQIENKVEHVPKKPKSN